MVTNSIFDVCGTILIWLHKREEIYVWTSRPFPGALPSEKCFILHVWRLNYSWNSASCYGQSSAYACAIWKVCLLLQWAHAERTSKQAMQLVAWSVVASNKIKDAGTVMNFSWPCKRGDNGCTRAVFRYAFLISLINRINGARLPSNSKGSLSFACSRSMKRHISFTTRANGRRRLTYYPKRRAYVVHDWKSRSRGWCRDNLKPCYPLHKAFTRKSEGDNIETASTELRKHWTFPNRRISAWWKSGQNQVVATRYGARYESLVSSTDTASYRYFRFYIQIQQHARTAPITGLLPGSSSWEEHITKNVLPDDLPVNIACFTCGPTPKIWCTIREISLRRKVVFCVYNCYCSAEVFFNMPFGRKYTTVRLNTHSARHKPSFVHGQHVVVAKCARCVFYFYFYFYFGMLMATTVVKGQQKSTFSALRVCLATDRAEFRSPHVHQYECSRHQNTTSACFLY